MRSWLLRCATGLAILCGQPHGPAYAQPANTLTSAPIDPSIYREDAIRRTGGRHGNWTFVCDEVVKIRKRFCSLRTTILSTDGQPIAALTVSTGQDGKPAALLHMEASLAKDGIEVAEFATALKAREQPTTKPAKQNAAKPTQPVIFRVYPANCAPDICQLIWTLPAHHIQALNNPAAGLKVSVPSASRALHQFVIPATGFSAAVDASLAQSPKPSQ